MKLSKPGPEHARLEALAGRWNLVIKQLDAPGSGDAKGTAEFKWVMGKRFLHEETRCTLGGDPFEWQGWHGYDNATKKHIVAFIDNLGTGIDLMEGTWDEATRTLTYLGEDFDPATVGKQKVKWALKFEGKDKVVTTMSSIGPDGKETKVMEIMATRM